MSHVINAVLFEGWFYARIMEQKTKVDFKIRNNYEVTASFACQDIMYQFNMKKWAKTRETVQNPSRSFNFFAGLMFDRFEQSSEFGTQTVEQTPEGGERIVIERSPQQIINMLKYAVVDVFNCAEEIIRKYRRSVLDYAIHHRELGKHSTYEEYVHLVACHCLVHSNFHAPNLDFPLVDFCTVEQAYKPSILEGITSRDDENEAE